jgi:ATP-dependent exoDNAse (exonuclease V) alpha subunit
VLPVTLSSEFKAVLDQLEYSHDNFFITGRAGTGKSTLLQLFRKTSRKKIAVLAPTGIAALHVRGQTIHSFFGFPPRMLNQKEIEKRKNRRLYTSLEMIVIDEISMVRADLLDNIDYFLRINRETDLPFGGVQMIFFGDLFQLPPVVSTSFEREYFQTRYESPYFFSSDVVRQNPVQIIELHRIYRQEEKLFIQLLDNIRMATLEYEDFELLQTRCVALPTDKSFYITLCTRNDLANRINEEELRAIDVPSFAYTAKVEGEFVPQNFPTELHLSLKAGAQVMFIRNDIEKRYVNGTIGIITELNYDIVRVCIKDALGEARYIEVERQTWEMIRYEPDPQHAGQILAKVIGTFTQYPLRLAWAMTIHKSQGKTFDRVIIDLGGGAFESGQTYVGLSRCRTLDGIILKQQVKSKDIILDPRLVEFYQNIKYLH